MLRSTIKNARQRKRARARLERLLRIAIKRFNGWHDWASRGYYLELVMGAVEGRQP